MANIIIFGWFKIFTVIKHLDLLFEPLEISFFCWAHVCLHAHMSTFTTCLVVVSFYTKMCKYLSNICKGDKWFR